MKPLPTPSRGGDPVNPHVVEATAEPKPDFEAMRKECFTFPEHLEDALRLIPHEKVTIRRYFDPNEFQLEAVGPWNAVTKWHTTWQEAFAELWGML